MRPALRRVLLFIVVFSLLPALGAAAALPRVARPKFYLAQAIARHAPGFALWILAQALLASIAWSMVLGLTSLWAWPSRGWPSALRAVRLAGALWIAGVILYPGLASFLPPLSYLPWGVAIAWVVLVWLLSCLPRSLRPGYRELALTAMLLVAFLTNPLPRSPNLRRIAGRQFTARDVILLGFDSVSEADTAEILRNFSPSSGTKVVFANASTTVDLTGGAWRSIFSGKIPAREDLLPGSIWPKDAGPWLPRLLAQLGYRPTLLQDDPTTNTYRRSEFLRLTQPQGWRAGFTEFAWGVAFPLSMVGGRSWVGGLGGPAMEPEEYAYCARCFLNSGLSAMAEDARKGPVFWAMHTCYLHGPVALSLGEVLKLRGWSWRTPRQLRGAGLQRHDSFGRTELEAARLESVKNLLHETLKYLDGAGVLGHATVIVLSDHGPRGESVPWGITTHVMLTAFIPGERKDVFVREPVSLIDLAPTLAGLMGIDMPLTDGIRLPLDGRSWQPRRSAADISPQRNPVEELDTWRLSAETIQRLLTFHEDGTYSVDASLITAAMAGAKTPS